MAGYSGTPLAKKLGIKAGTSVKLINAPEYYFDLFTDWPINVSVNLDERPSDVIHFFTLSSIELTENLLNLKNDLKPNGCIWVSWPKKSSKVATDVTENMIRDHAISIGLVDIKVCAVDEIWSGLKMVIPLKDRIK